MNVTGRYEYIVNLDNDEVIMPIKHKNWSDMMEEVLPDSRAKQKQAWEGFGLATSIYKICNQ